MKLNLVPARTGLLWVRQGIGAFGRQPMALTALFFSTMAAMSLVSLLPLVGTVLALGLLPTATLVMMVAAAQAQAGHLPTPALLLLVFRAGRQRLHAMLVLGALYAGGFLLMMGASALVDGGEFASVYLGSQALTSELASSASFQGAMWLALALYLPLSLLFWHAPGLVHWHNVPPVKALFFSIVACLRNVRALLVYGLGWLGVSILAGTLISVLAGLLALWGLGAGMVGTIMVITALMLATMFFSSVVFTFRDSFAPPQITPSPEP